ncbi:membrane integrity-associated transporter subunit PqiC [Morganella morganii]|uniref:membrane integrity-associated transporter subunit PqiC n=1 Tax=Morganella morganii TaxID=582 RepID=UPI0021D12B8E|nr:membrane integrity-associated transporter subunit PqiC [Morganella morganii]MCU6354773.1 membrane integrity-associated transporter subunit PqiC [Morganella morganii]
MKKLTKALVFLGVFVLAGCSSTPVKQYYQLPVVAAADSSSEQTSFRSTGSDNRHPQLWIQRITLGDVLGNAGIVYQTSDVEYNIGSTNLWAGPLEQQLLEVMTTELSQALPDRLVSVQPLEGKPDTLTVTVTGFHGRYDGKVIVAGSWIYTHGDAVIRHPFNLVLEQAENGYPALVRTLGEGWAQVSKSVADELRK